VEVRDLLDRVHHAYSHFRITLHAHHALLRKGTPRAASATAWRWVEPSGLDEFAFPAANVRLIEALRSQGAPDFG